MTYIKLLLTAFFWGGTFIAGKGIADTVDPYSAAFLRFAIASFFLVCLTLKTQKKLPGLNRQQAVLVFFSGLTGIFAYNLFFFTGLGIINANRASLIIATNPIFISLAAALLFKDKLTPGKGIGLVLSVTGALLIISEGDLRSILTSGIGRGELAIFGCVFSWVSYSILGKPLMTHLSPLTCVCYSSLAGTAMLLVPALGSGMLGKLSGYGVPEWGSLFYLGFFGTVLGFYWDYQGIRTIGPTRSGVFINFVPVSALILSYFILGETVTPDILMGALLVVTGVYLTNHSKTATGTKDRQSHGTSKIKTVGKDVSG
ncbi:MAG TPA: EamA family transporter [Desulfobacteraceae bacterium]|nr:EamA family transporter [Desulfobacteraceae bacterium]